MSHHKRLETLFDEVANSRPHQLAIIDERNRVKISYGDLRHEANILAEKFKKVGLERGTRVLVATPMSIHLYVTLLAIWRAGLVAVVPDASRGLGGLRTSVRRAEVSAVCAPLRFAPLAFVVPELRAIPHKFFVDRRFWKKTKHNSMLVAEAKDDESPAILTFTSGSTSEPKMAVRSHTTMMAQLEAILADTKLGGTNLDTMPIVLLANLAAGGTSVIPNITLERIHEADGNKIADAISDYRCTTMIGSPAILERVTRAARTVDPRLAGLRDAYTGGAPVFPKTLDDFARVSPNTTLHAVYGSTEAEPIAHLRHDEIAEKDLKRMKSGEGLLAGRATDHTKIAIITSRPGTSLGPWTTQEFDEQHLPQGAIGEIVVSGPHVLRGYHEGVGDEETKIRVGEGIWHRTGDLGSLDSTSRIWLYGRTTAIQKSRSGDIYPLAVECEMSFRPNIARSALANIGDQVILAVESSTDDMGATPTGIDLLKRVPRIPVDRRHGAKTDYPALKKLLAQGPKPQRKRGWGGPKLWWLPHRTKKGIPETTEISIGTNDTTQDGPHSNR